jgi:hypothetical protein
VTLLLNFVVTVFLTWSFAFVCCSRCGSKVPCLFVEFSPGNIKLTRCVSTCIIIKVRVLFFCICAQDECHKVADKYIEYELVIVLVDLVLHRVPAYRHIYRNRHDMWSTNVSIY